MRRKAPCKAESCLFGGSLPVGNVRQLLGEPLGTLTLDAALVMDRNAGTIGYGG